jgi:hypothetical protein
MKIQATILRILMNTLGQNATVNFLLFLHCDPFFHFTDLTLKYPLKKEDFFIPRLSQRERPDLLRDQPIIDWAKYPNLKFPIVSQA